MPARQPLGRQCYGRGWRRYDDSPIDRREALMYTLNHTLSPADRV